VSNDDDGNVTFQIVVPNRTDFGDGDFVQVYLDVDRSVSTGCTLGSSIIGIDWSLFFRGRNEPDLDNDPNFAGPVSSSCSFPQPDESQLEAVKGSFDGRTSTISLRVNRKVVGNPTSFNFLLITTIDSGEPFAVVEIGDWDLAPSRGVWGYDIRVSPKKPTPPKRDRTPPRVRALASTGAAGGTAKLRYTVFDESGRAGEVITVLDGRRVAATVRTKVAARRATAVQVRSWRVPPAFRRKLTFCVVARDAAGNRSAKSCAPLTIR